MLVRVLLTSTSNPIFLIAQKMTCPYLAQDKELLPTSSCHPLHLQMTWYAPKASTTPNHGHIYTYNIYKFFCLTAMNMKYLLHTSCTRYVQIYHDIQQVHTGCKRELHSFDITKSWINFPKKKFMWINVLNIHTYLRVKMDWYMVLL